MTSHWVAVQACPVGHCNLRLEVGTLSYSKLAEIIDSYPFTFIPSSDWASPSLAKAVPLEVNSHPSKVVDIDPFVAVVQSHLRPFVAVVQSHLRPSLVVVNSHLLPSQGHFHPFP